MVGVKRTLIKCQYIVAIIVLFVFVACSYEDNNVEKKHKSYESVKFPKAFNNDEAIMSHLHKLSENLEQFSEIMENIVDDLVAQGINYDEEPTLRQKIAILRIITPQVQPVAQIVSNIYKLDEVSKSIKDTLPEEKLNAFLAFEQQYTERFENLNKRFEQYMK